eukprot:gene1771-1801_t
MRVKLSSAAIEAMIAAAAAAYPREACGLLLGQGAIITAAQPTANVAPQPETHFEIDPAALIAAHRAARSGAARSGAARSGAARLIGYFHSHPNGRADPSPTDRAMAAHDGHIWAIITPPSGAGAGALALWRDAPSGFEPLSYDVVDG